MVSDKSLDGLLSGLRSRNLGLYDRVATPATVAYYAARDEFVLKHPRPGPSGFSSGVAYSLALNTWFADLRQYQVDAFLRVVRGVYLER